ncbi:hypothetical protein TNCT_223221 [Trichonephila clavata]|uniref:Uncharacterized protein n=1 Tax=Trichonephila clavata TaxID=2740835 RepID=A0A8X6L019_TRICU|nr:hypothetical protein TNCT_223221 [Trichonephila clavata]
MKLGFQSCVLGLREGYQREKDKLKLIFRNNVSCHDHSVTKNPAFGTVKFELRQTKSNGVSRSRIIREDFDSSIEPFFVRKILISSKSLGFVDINDL